jgi:hypothetical protein
MGSSEFIRAVPFRSILLYGKVNGGRNGMRAVPDGRHEKPDERSESRK